MPASQAESGGGTCGVTRRCGAQIPEMCSSSAQARGAGYVCAEPAQWRRPLPTSRVRCSDLHKTLGGGAECP